MTEPPEVMVQRMADELARLSVQRDRMLVDLERFWANGREWVLNYYGIGEKK